MKASWKEVSQRALNKPHSSKVRGVKVTLMISPLDVPSASRVEFDEEEGKFVIEFKYLSGEERKRDVVQEDGVVFRVGKNSGKIYMIMLDGEQFLGDGVEQVDLKIGLRLAETEIEQFESSSVDNLAARAGNITAIKNFLSAQLKGQAASWVY